MAIVGPGLEQTEQTPVILEETLLARADVFDLAAHFPFPITPGPQSQDERLRRRPDRLFNHTVRSLQHHGRKFYSFATDYITRKLARN